MNNDDAGNLLIRNRNVFQYDEDMLQAIDRAVKCLRFVEKNYPDTFEDYLTVEQIRERLRNDTFN